MINDPSTIHFKRAAVDPVLCLKQGWELIKDKYWLFVGLSLVGMLIGGAVPLGILMGPMMCGIYICFFHRRRGEFFEFATLFKGFDYFGQSVIATLIHVIPILLIAVPGYIIFEAGIFLTVVGQQGEPNPTTMFTIFGVAAVFWLAMILIILLISIAFTFTYPLIVDRGLTGVEAVKLSARAAMANFWRLVALSLLSFVLSLVGLALCFVGVYLVLPVTYAALEIAYEQVFGLGQPRTNLPPPPPRFT